MKISEAAIRRGVTTMMVFVLVVVLGAVAIPKIPLEFMPKMDIPYIEVHVPYEGASPVEISDQIAEPIEEAISTLPGIDKIMTRCRSGYAYIGIELAPSAKMDYMVLDVQERIDSIRKDLPEDVNNILIQKFDTEQFPIIMGAITFPEDSADNADLLDRYVIRPLKTVEGVASIQVEGLEEQRVLVEIDQDKLTAYHVSVLQVFEVLTAANMTISAGSVDFAEKSHNVRIVGEFKDLDEIRRLPITGTVSVGDVADVRVHYEKPFFIGRLNKRRCYIMFILKESGANTVDACRAVNKELEKLFQDPRLKDVNMYTWFDQSKEITQSIKILTETGVVGAGLAFLVLYLFLKSIRATVIVSMAIPMSILTTIACMYFLEISFNVITLSALIVGVGMLVDNSIVVLESIDLSHRRGMTPFHASLEGSNEVGLAISVATTTTVIVFLPLIFTEQSEASILMKQLGMVLALAISSSLFVSLTLIPLMASRLLRPIPRRMPKWFEKTSSVFLKTLERGLDHRFVSLLIVGLLFIASIAVFAWPDPKLIEKEAVPAALIKIVRVSVKFERKPPIEEVDAKMAVLEDLFLEKKEEWDLETVAAIVTPVFTRILLVLPNDRQSKYTAEELRDMVNDFLEEKVDWPGVSLDTAGEGHGGPPGSQVGTSIKVRGPDPDQVYFFAEMIRNKILGVKGLKEIKEIEKDGELELHVLVDRDLAKQYGFEAGQVAMAVSYSVRGVMVGQMHTGDSPTDIYIQVKEADRKSRMNLESMMIQNARGDFIPLKNVAKFREVPIPEQVRRDNRLITARIPIIPEGKDLAFVADRVKARLANLKLPMGYSWVFGEEFEETKEDLKTLAIAILLAMVLVFLVMTAQFESFFLPFVIMFTLPFAIIGVVVALLVSRATFNVLSGAGCLLLVGIVVNNAIVLVDHVHNLRKKGLGKRESLMQAASDRFRPIMMTALTTIVGLFPMALGLNDTGSMMYSPLAIAVLGGLVASTFFTPFVIPVIYSLSDSLTEKLQSAWRNIFRTGQ